MEARNVLMSITGSSDLSLKEVGEAINIIQTRITSPSILLGVATDVNLNDEVKLTLFATGIGKSTLETGKHILTRPKKQVELPLEEKKTDELNLDDIISTPTFERKQKRD